MCCNANIETKTIAQKIVNQRQEKWEITTMLVFVYTGRRNLTPVTS